MAEAAKSSSKSKSSDSKASDSTASTSKTSTEKSTDTSASSESDSKTKSGSGGGGSRPISYFSSVSNDDYRSGWDAIFSGGKAPEKKKAANQSVKPKAKQLAAKRVEITEGDLTPALKQELETLFRKKLKRRRLDYDALNAAGGIEWNLVIEADPNVN